MNLHGQIDLFDDAIKEGETFVIVVQEVLENNSILQKKLLREYQSLTAEMMKNLYEHLRDIYLNEKLSDNGQYFTITVYTNEDYAGENIFAHVKRYKNSKEWTATAK